MRHRGIRRIFDRHSRFARVRVALKKAAADHLPILGPAVERVDSGVDDHQALPAAHERRDRVLLLARDGADHSGTRRSLAATDAESAGLAGAMRSVALFRKSTSYDARFAR